MSTLKCCGTCRFYTTKKVNLDNGMPNTFINYCIKNKDLLINSGFYICNYWKNRIKE